MEQKVLQGNVRADIGKGPVGRLRKTGKIPAIIYGHEKCHSIAIDAREFGQKFKTVSENTIITIHTEQGDHDVLVKDYQEDLATGRIMHIDFYEIETNKVLKTRVPFHIAGTAPGVREGGVLETLLHDLEIECLPRDIPQSITVDISTLAVGSSIHVSDIALPAGIRVLAANDQVIVTVAHQKAEVVAAVVEPAAGVAAGVAAPVAEAPAPQS
ncbi:MAG TPA: 50S ribosomal protein L25 [Spirochaetia bacterium]|nr:50S ribosomal protein L25 [Spirochaetia bacterium]